MKPYIDNIKAEKRFFDLLLTFEYNVRVPSPFDKGKKLKMHGSHSKAFTDKDSLLRFVLDNFSNGHDMVVTIERGWERWQR